MPLEMFTALIVFLFPLAYSPGPGNMFFAINGARFGFLRTLPSNAGYHGATWIVTMAVGSGFAWIGVQTPTLLVVIKFLGAFYVLYLAGSLAAVGTASSTGEAQAATFLDGAALLVFNPKAYLIIALMFSQFAGNGDDGTFARMVLISTVFTLNNFVAFVVWTVAGQQLFRLIANETVARRQNMIFAAMLASVAIWIVSTT